MALKQAFANDPKRLRKERSEKFLNKNNIRINTQLPAIEDENEAKIKSAEETLKRAVTALFASQIAMDCLNEGVDIRESAAFFCEMLRRFGFSDEPTADEKRFFALADNNAEKPPKRAADEMARRIEMTVPLLWALGIVKELGYPNKPSDYIAEARKIVSCKDFGELMTICDMRKPAKILDMADLLFRMDWACADARLKDKAPSGSLNFDVVAERHKGLNWLIGAVDAEDWDNVKIHI